MATTVVASPAAATDAPSRTFINDVWRRFRRAPGALTGAAIVAFVVIVAAFAPLLAGHDPLAQNLANQAQAPSAAHWFGTDKLGRDLFARIVYGARVSIRIGFVAVGVAISAGTLIGLIAGYAGGPGRPNPHGRDGHHAGVSVDHPRHRDHNGPGTEHQ